MNNMPTFHGCVLVLLASVGGLYALVYIVDCVYRAFCE